MRKRVRMGLVVLALFIWIVASGGSRALGKGRGGGGGKGGGKASTRYGGGSAKSLRSGTWGKSYKPPQAGSQGAGSTGHSRWGGADRAAKGWPGANRSLAPQPDPGDPPFDLVDPGRKLTGRENALYRQLRNEQRKLAKRWETAHRLREAYAHTGDEELMQAADYLEQRALDHFAKRMAAIDSFQQRHGLTDLFEELTGVEGLSSGPVGDALNPLGSPAETLVDRLRGALAP